MPRKGLRPRDRRGFPDPDHRFKSVLVSRFINKLNYQGKKLCAEYVFYGALDTVKDKLKEDPLNVFNTAVENVRPLLEVRARRG